MKNQLSLVSPTISPDKPVGSALVELCPFAAAYLCWQGSSFLRISFVILCLVWSVAIAEHNQDHFLAASRCTFYSPCI